MRISDWSSDVCSSDLILEDRSKAFVALGPANRVAVIDAKSYEVIDYILVGQRVWQLALSPDETKLFSTNGVSNDITMIDVEGEKAQKSVAVGSYPWGIARSEEHTSELQSLMRI